MERLKAFALTLIVIFLIFTIFFFIFLPILEETDAFDPESKVEPVTHYGGLMGYSLIIFDIISLVIFFILLYYFNLYNLIYFVLIFLIDLASLLFSFAIAFLFFDITNLFLATRIPPFIPMDQGCANTDNFFNSLTVYYTLP